jgi:hypothetical protein
MKGREPYRANTLVANHLRVAAAKAGIIGPVGWHTFRRSISGWLIDNDENVKVTQELMRHAQAKTTLDLYCKGGNAVEASGTREEGRWPAGRFQPKREPRRPSGNCNCGLSVGCAFSANPVSHLEFGGQRRDRTADAGLFRAALYH